MIPHININADMTEYLPKDSRMREGLDTMKRVFPLVDMNAPQIKVMVAGDGSSSWVDSVRTALESRQGIATVVSTRVKDSLALFECYGSSFDDVVRIADELKASGIVAETNANSNMPEGMGSLLIAGVALIFVILFVMCASVVEALLFILTIGLAVVINMGTNALLPSVSMMTNTIVAVLQFVLSMDYSIILMSRFRYEKAQGAGVDSAVAMSRALRSASSSILSSSFTTIVGLLALVFMKFRIGLDLGVVLSKGVFCSLVCIYTVLPGLVLIFEKWIVATTKKVPVFPTDRLAQYEVKYRWVLSVVFIVLFAGALVLQSRTRLSYASVWESEIAKVFPPQTSFMVLYQNDDKAAVPAMLDSVVALVDGGESGSVMTVSWPSIMKRPFTAEELIRMIAENAPEALNGAGGAGLTEDNIRMLFYAWAHPERTERMSFDDILALADEAGRMGLIPEGIDVSSIAEMFVPADEDADVLAEEQGDAGAGAGAGVGAGAGTGESENLQNSGEIVENLGDSAAFFQDLGKNMEFSRYTYENCTHQRSSTELAGFLGFSESNAKTIYSLAGRKGGTMSVAEFLDFINAKVLTNKLMRKAISAKQRAGLASATASVDSALAVGPDSLILASTGIEMALNFPDSLILASGGGEMALNSPDSLGKTPIAVNKPEKLEPTPMERLAQMAMSGKKYSSKQIAKALEDAGILAGTKRPGTQQAGGDLKFDARTIDLMFMYYGYKQSLSKRAPATQTRMTLEQLLDFLTSKVLKDPMFASFIPEGAEEQIGQMREMIDEKLGQLHGAKWSMAAIMTELPVEAPETFEFVGNLKQLTDNNLQKPHYVIGEPVMYKEMDDGFGRELVLLTIITIGSIFLIVAVTFRSLVIPLILVLSVMTGVFVNVYVSGIGGRTMLYLAYLIVQSILMGATIDYGILLTNCYKEIRKSGEGKVKAMMKAYRMAMPTIMTSGMILVFAPYVVSMVMTAPSIRSILSCLSVGAAAALTVIIFLLPAMLTACDRFVTKRN